MNNNLNLSEKDKLNGSNFENWKWKLENVLMVEGLEVFIEKDRISEVTQEVSAGTATNKDLETTQKNAKKGICNLS